VSNFIPITYKKESIFKQKNRPNKNNPPFKNNGINAKIGKRPGLKGY